MLQTFKDPKLIWKAQSKELIKASLSGRVFDKLVTTRRELKKPADQISGILIKLEIMGVVQNLGQGRYCL